MKKRILWLVPIIIVVLAVIAFSVPSSPFYLPELMVQGGVYDGKSTSYWTAALNSSDPAERKQAITAIGSIGPQATKAVPILAKIMTDDPDRELRNAAALTLSKMDPASKEAIPALIQAVGDKEGPVRMNAIIALFRLKTASKPAVPVLINALNDDNNLTNLGIFHYSIQEMAALALGRASAGTTDAVPQLIEFLKRASTPLGKESGMRGIGEVGAAARPDAEPLLVGLLKDRDRQIRETAKEILLKIGADVPDVGALPPDEPPLPRPFGPGGPGFPAGKNQPPGGDPKGKSKDDPKGKGKTNDKDRGRAAREPEYPELAVAEREYLWEIEHHGNVLVKHGFGPLALAIKQADSAALSRLLAPQFTGADLVQPQNTAVATSYVQAERGQSTGPAAAVMSGEHFVKRLLDARKVFTGAPPQVKFSLMTLSPKKRGQLDGLWAGAAQLRLHGESTPGAPAEVVLKFNYEIPRPTEEALANPGWLRSAIIVQSNLAKAPNYLFREVAKERGLDAARLYDSWSSRSFNPTSGGCYVCDFDRDGILDVLITDWHGQALYRGLPTGGFADVTIEFGLPAQARTELAAWIDIDGDGWDDLLMAQRIWRNENGRRFVDYTERCNLRLSPKVNNVVVADYNRDGRLDLYVPRVGSPSSGSWIEGTCDAAQRNYLFRNNGNWQFEDVTRASRTEGNRRSTFTAAWLDADNDGWPDLHVPNEFGDGVLLVNNKDGTFREQPLANRPADFGTMGLAVGDINNDGNIDIYCANMYSKAGTRVIGNLTTSAYSDTIMEKMRRFVAGSQLHLNRGGLRFDQAGPALQVAAVGWAYGACLEDLDNDGWLDIYATAGYVSRNRDEPDG